MIVSIDVRHLFGIELKATKEYAMRDLRRPIDAELLQRWDKFSKTKAYKKARFRKARMRRSSGTEEETENIEFCNVKITSATFFFRILHKHVHGGVKVCITICKTMS